MSPRVHHAVFSVAGWIAGMAGFVAFCLLFTGYAGPNTDPVVSPVAPAIE